jgi:hypothetical protein
MRVFPAARIESLDGGTLCVVQGGGVSSLRAWAVFLVGAGTTALAWRLAPAYTPLLGIGGILTMISGLCFALPYQKLEVHLADRSTRSAFGVWVPPVGAIAFWRRSHHWRAGDLLSIHSLGSNPQSTSINELQWSNSTDNSIWAVKLADVPLLYAFDQASARAVVLAVSKMTGLALDARASVPVK